MKKIIEIEKHAGKVRKKKVFHENVSCGEKKQQEEGRPKLFLYLGLILFTVPNKIIQIKDNKIFEKWSQKT